MSWLPTSVSAREGASFTRKGKEKETDPGELVSPITRLPSEPSAPYTLAHAVTPGWDIPWSSRLAAQGPLRNHENSYGFENENDEEEESNKDVSLWGKRKQRFRNFILTNTYVPLVSSCRPFQLPYQQLVRLVVSLYKHRVYDRCPWHGHSNKRDRVEA